MPPSGPRQNITAELTVHNATEAIAFYETAMGAVVKGKELVEGDPKGRVMYSLLQVPGGGDVMVHDDFPDWSPDGQLKTPIALGGTPCVMNLSLATPEEVDALVEKSCKAGMQVECPPTDMFWGDRHAMLKDPYGHVWSLVAALPADRKAAVADKVPKGDAGKSDQAWGPPAKKARLTRATLKEDVKIAASVGDIFRVWVDKHQQIQPLPEASVVHFDPASKYEVDAVERSRVEGTDGSPMCSFEERVIDMEEDCRVVWHSVCKMPSGERLSSSIQTVEFVPEGSQTKVILTEQVTWFKMPLMSEHKAGLARFLKNLEKAVAEC
mmetsp:Transcript_17832/g.41583  ORF Transcript_17832/g.41583 Transcript_17832/m.41583 type:complete len:324 (-) Transcript_17832:217-1188(-)